MDIKDNKVFLRHILDEINYLEQAAKGKEYGKFMQDETLKRACARSIEIIGEATKNLSMDFRRKHKGVEWKKLAGIRDKVIHYYFGVNWDIVWDVIEERLPALKGQIEKLLNE